MPAARDTMRPERGGEDGGLNKEALAAWERRAAEAEAEPLTVVRVGDAGADVLRQKAKAVRHANRRVRELIARMRATMYRENGVGLAAPQVGVSLRVLVADAGDRHCALVNPEVVSAEGTQTTPMEGCLSIPDLVGEVERAEHVRVRGLDPAGHEVWVDAEGYFARVLQHEIDHLDGILFTDRATRVVRAGAETKLKVVFMGTSDFGAEVLRVCLDGDVVPAVVVTRPDRPSGRGLKLQSSPVRRLAEEAEISVLTPERARDEDLYQRLAAENPDVIVTAAYGQIIPERLLRLPRLGAVNVHPSALPRHRGPDPIRRTLWEGDGTTAVTVLFMSREVDAGDILLQEPVEIAPEEDAGVLAGRLATLGGQVLLRALRELAIGKAQPAPQDGAQATYAAKISPEEEVADFSLPAAQLVQRIRALAPRPGLRTSGGLKLLRAAAEPCAQAGLEPGSVAWVRPEGIAVVTGGGLLVVQVVQPAGGRVMEAQAYANGRRIQAGDFLT